VRAHIELTRDKQAGYTMIEVLMAMAYLTVGLFGILAMEDISISRNVDSKRLTVATTLASEMIDRIRMNSPANINRVLAPAIPGSPYLYHGILVCGRTPPTNCPGQGFTATPGNTGGAPPPNSTAFGDYQQWLAHISETDFNGVSALPNGIGTVSSTPLGPAVLGQLQIDVTVQWTSGLRRPSITMSTLVAPL